MRGVLGPAELRRSSAVPWVALFCAEPGEDGGGVLAAAIAVRLPP